MKNNRHPSWLPSDWTVESKVVKKGPSSGSTYKCYTESSTGKKLYSRPKVLSYLQKCGKNIVHTSQQQASSQTNGQQPEPELAPTPPELTEDEWNAIAEIYNKTVSGSERFPTRQNSSSIAFQNGCHQPNAPAMEEDDQGKVIIMSSTEMEDLMDQMLAATTQGSSVIVAAASEQESAVPKTMPSRSSKRLAGAEPDQLQMLLAEDSPPRKTGPRSARRRATHFGNMDSTVVVAAAANPAATKLAPENVNGPPISVEPMKVSTMDIDKTGPSSARQRATHFGNMDSTVVVAAANPATKLAPQKVNGPPISVEPMEESSMDIDKVENTIVEPSDAAAEKENLFANDQENEVVKMEPLPRFHKDTLSKPYVEFAIKVLGCEYEVTNHPTAKQLHDEAISSDPFFEYACATAPDPSEVPLYGYDLEKQLLEFERDLQRCKELPNFGFPVSFDADVSVHFGDSLSAKYGEASSSVRGVQGDQSQKDIKSSG